MMGPIATTLCEDAALWRNATMIIPFLVPENSRYLVCEPFPGWPRYAMAVITVVLGILVMLHHYEVARLRFRIRSVASERLAGMLGCSVRTARTSVYWSLVLLTVMHKFHFTFNIMFPAPCAEPDFLYRPGALGVHMDRTFLYGMLPSLASVLAAHTFFTDTAPSPTAVLPSDPSSRLILAALCFGACCSLSLVSLGHYVVASPFVYSYSPLAHASILMEGLCAIIGVPISAWIMLSSSRTPMKMESTSVDPDSGLRGPPAPVRATFEELQAMGMGHLYQGEGGANTSTSPSGSGQQELSDAAAGSGLGSAEASGDRGQNEETGEDEEAPLLQRRAGGRPATQQAGTPGGGDLGASQPGSVPGTSQRSRAKAKDSDAEGDEDEGESDVAIEGS